MVAKQYYGITEEFTRSRIIGAVRGCTLNYWEQLSLYVPHRLRINMTRCLAHLQLSDSQGEIRPIYRTSDLQGECLYAERNGNFPY